MARQRARLASVGDDGELLTGWYTIETAEGNAVSGVDGRFDFATEEAAEDVLQSLIVEVGKPLSVIAYARLVVATYAAVTRIEKVDE